MNPIPDLEALGYTFTLDGDAIRYAHSGAHPDPETVRALLAELRARKVEAVHLLRARQTAPAPWEGATVKLADWPAFKRQHGLRLMRIEWPAGEGRPLAVCEAG